jgi:formylglycine-generating enzyme required for sulfatase activity
MRSSAASKARPLLSLLISSPWARAPLAALAAALLWPLAAFGASAEPVEIVKNSLGVYFRHIPAGRFNMGAGPGFSGEPQYETPAHQVSLTKPFRLSIHEITVGQWLAVMGGKAAKGAGPMDPIANVSWEDVQIFLDRLSQADGVKYRLPTEAEWEYAARAGTEGPWYFGSDAALLPDHAWCGGDVAKGEAQPVGRKPPNPWGLYDMYGNVAEWVADWFGEDYYSAKAQTNPRGPASGTMRGLRGGSYASGAEACQSAWREGDLPMSRNRFIGFRLAYDE